jgi:snurportin-1
VHEWFVLVFTPSRFWWRDTRLAELTQTLPPLTSTHSNFVPPTPLAHQPSDHATQALSQSLKYRFPYPTTFVSVPYYTDTTLGSLDATVIPAARSVREVLVMVPLVPTPAPLVAGEDKGMEMELPPCAPSGYPITSSFAFQAPHVNPTSLPTNPSSTLPQNTRLSQPQTFKAYVQPDGLLLYVAEASYEHGTSPLSSWVPISAYDHKDYEPDESIGAEDLNQRGTNNPVEEEEGLLGCFHG